MRVVLLLGLFNHRHELGNDGPQEIWMGGGLQANNGMCETAMAGDAQVRDPREQMPTVDKPSSHDAEISTVGRLGENDAEISTVGCLRGNDAEISTVGCLRRNGAEI